MATQDVGYRKDVAAMSRSLERVVRHWVVEWVVAWYAQKIASRDSYQNQEKIVQRSAQESTMNECLALWGRKGRPRRSACRKRSEGYVARDIRSTPTCGETTTQRRRQATKLRGRLKQGRMDHEGPPAHTKTRVAVKPPKWTSTANRAYPPKVRTMQRR